MWSEPTRPCLRKTPPIGGAALKNMSKILLDQTVPELSGNYGNDLDLLAEAGWKDCFLANMVL